MTSYYRTMDLAARRRVKVPIMGVLQGWYADEYARCAREMLAGDAPALVGLGSVCRRRLHGPAGVLAIVQALDAELPTGTRLHLFGIKSGALAALAPYADRIASCDSCAWDMAVRRRMPTGRTQEVRAHAMRGCHARQTVLVGTARGHARAKQPHLLQAMPRLQSSEAVALEAVGKVLAELHASNDLSYLDVRWLTEQDAYVVQALLRSRGVQAFAEEEPDDDFGLGMVYAGVRDALVAAGHLVGTSKGC